MKPPWKASHLPALVVCLPIFYIFSVGPAYRTCTVLDSGRPDSGLSWQVFTTVYAPLIWANRQFPPVHAALDWYTDLWEPSAPAME